MMLSHFKHIFKTSKLKKATLKDKEFLQTGNIRNLTIHSLNESKVFKKS